MSLSPALADSTSINSVIDQKTGEFKRPDAQFRSFISSDSNSVFRPEKGRYHLYVSYACPWGKVHIRVVLLERKARLTHILSASNLDCPETEGVGKYY